VFMERVLLIEDDPILLENLTDVLRSENFEVLAASDAETALSLADTQVPDLIVSDIMLPGMDGLQLSRRLSNEPHTATIPIIFLTAKTAPEDLRAGLDLGADDYLFKPCSADKLLSIIRLRLAKRKQLEDKLIEKWRGLRQATASLAPSTLALPLQHILGFAEVLSRYHDKMERTEIGRMSDEIAAAAFRASRLLANYFIQGQFRASGGSQLPEGWKGSGATDAPSVLQRAARTCADAHGRTQDISVSAEPATVDIPEHALEKIVLELVDNACRYSRPRTAIQVSGKRVAGGYQVSVLDHGVGLTAARLADLKRSEARTVTDLPVPRGLDIVHLLLHSHQSDLQIASTPLQSTECSFLIPE